MSQTLDDTQSAGVVHTSKHEVASAQIRLPGQGAPVAVGQLPAPSQLDCGVSVLPEQLAAGPQGTLVEALAHVPCVALPAVQVPGLQVVAVPQSASLPDVTATQFPDALHAWHAPAHALLQHTPSTQVRPMAHWPEEQVAPWASPMQVPPVLVHIPLAH